MLESSNLQKELERFYKHVIKQSRTNLTKKGKNSSKKLYNSMDFNIKVSKNSLDTDFVKNICEINIPIIIAGGCGEYEHMNKVLKYKNISAVAAGSIFYFTEKTPAEAKIYLNKKNILVRKT